MILIRSKQQYTLSVRKHLQSECCIGTDLPAFRNSVSSSGFAKSHLDNCTVKKDSEKTSLGKENFTDAIAVTKVPPEL